MMKLPALLSFGCWLALSISEVVAEDASALSPPERVPIRLGSNPALSPDGRQLVFSWAGDLWLTRSRGGLAQQLTAHPAYDSSPAFSPDGATMYVNDSFNRQTFAYEIRPDDLKATKRRVFATYTEAEGMPDGLTVDAEGFIWSAQWGGAAVIRLSPQGDHRAHYSVAAGNVTSQCFGETGSSTLRITTASDGLPAHTLAAYPMTGSLFTLDAPAPGLPEPLFPVE